MRRRLQCAILGLLLGVPGLAGFAGSDPCACSDATCCRAAKRPAPARAHCHDDEPSARWQCHHPEKEGRLPVLIALLPGSPTTATAVHAEPLAVRSATSLLPGFSRLDLPPPRPPRAA